MIFVRKNNIVNCLFASSLIALFVLTVVPTIPAFAQTNTADIVFVVDESGSMIAEHAFLSTIASQLETALNAQGVGGGGNPPNQYALVGYACSSGVGSPRVITNPGLGTIPAFSLAATPAGATPHPGTPTRICSQGGIQDGYLAIQFALNNINFRAGNNVAKQIILVTDENRDDLIPSTDFIGSHTNFPNNPPTPNNPNPPQTSQVADRTATENLLNAANVGLNVVVCWAFQDNIGGTAIGVITPNGGTAYVQDNPPAGGFTTTPNGSPLPNPAGAGGSIGGSCNANSQRGALTIYNDGDTDSDYITLAQNVGGGGWDLSFIQSGGFNAASFAAAFVDGKVQEILEVPVGGEIIPINTMALLVAGINANAFSLMGAFVLVGAAAFGALFYSVKRKN